MAVHFGGELEPEHQVPLINLGDRPPKIQRQALLNIYVSQGIMHRPAMGLFSAEPIEDIRSMRKLALDGTIVEITSRLKDFGPEAYKVTVEHPYFDPRKVFEQIDIRNLQYHYPSEYDSLLFTTVPEAQLQDVLLRGKPVSDGDKAWLGDYERQAIKEYALSEDADAIHATEFSRFDTAVFVPKQKVLLAYAPDCLQRIAPEAPAYEDYECDNFYAFIDSGLTRMALQAYVTRDDFNLFPMAAAVGESALAGAGAGGRH